MTVRALIIAIENYPRARGGELERQLPGVLKEGLEFREWLQEKWDQEGIPQKQRQVLICSEPKVSGGKGATTESIKEALLKLKSDGANRTKELYVYLSGHGFVFANAPGVRKNVIIASDFRTSQLSGSACLPIDEMVAWLRSELGPGVHAYFINACRNVLGSTQGAIGGLPPFGEQSRADEASVLMLFSAAGGRTVGVNNQFHAELIAGLRGKGRAKVWDDDYPGAMNVTFGSLCDQMGRHFEIDSRIEGKVRNIKIARLVPPPEQRCLVQLEGPVLRGGSVFYQRDREQRSKRVALDGARTILTLKPDAYSFRVKVKGADVEPALPIRQMLYDDITLTFRTKGVSKRSSPVGPERASGHERGRARKSDRVEASIVVPPGSVLELLDVNSRERKEFRRSRSVNLRPGETLATLRDWSGEVIADRRIEVSPGSRIVIDLAQWKGSTPHVSIAKYLKKQDDWVVFSPTLPGPVVDTDLDIWLALAGAGRILDDRKGELGKLIRLPLRNLRNEKEGASPIYVLAGFGEPFPSLKVGVTVGRKTKWSIAQSPKELSGICEAYFPVNAGSHLISFRIGTGPAYTVSTCAAANRAMLITFSVSPDGAPRVSQYLLPIGTHIDQLPERGRIRWRSHLADVLSLAKVCRAFHSRREIFREQLSKDQLNSLLYAKWIDPITSALISYEILRRGGMKDLKYVVDNMNQYFGYLPDSVALRVLTSKQKSTRPDGVPLFLDGLQAFPDYREWLPLPATHIDFSSPWTAWWAAVK